MIHKKFFIYIFLIGLQVFLLIGCSSTPGQVITTTEQSSIPVEQTYPTMEETFTPVESNTPPVDDITSTPEVPKVWSEDFEDESLDGWDTWAADGGFYIENGILTSTLRGDLSHLSSILFGTWSFDLYIDPNDKGSTHEFRFTEGTTDFQNLEIRQFQNTQIWITTQKDYSETFHTFVDLGEKLEGWHHFDITKNENGMIKVYLDGEFLFGHFDERSFDSESLVIMYCCKGPVLDNLEVQDQIIEIFPNE